MPLLWACDVIENGRHLGCYLDCLQTVSLSFVSRNYAWQQAGHEIRRERREGLGIKYSTDLKRKDELQAV